MKWKAYDKTKWHPWFAWHPVKIGDENVWLEYVERSVIEWGRFLGAHWDYRLPTAAGDAE